MRFKKTREVEKLEMENMEMKKILNQFMDTDQVFYVEFHLSIGLDSSL